MSKTPAEYQELLTQVYVKLTSKQPEDQGLFANDDFKNVVEELMRGFQEQNPGMEGMMDFARKHKFDEKAVMGMWMAVGVSAATRGDYQDAWVTQLRNLLESVGTIERFMPVMAMVDAYEAASNGRPHPEISQRQEMMDRGIPDPFTMLKILKEKMKAEDLAGSPLRGAERKGSTNTVLIENTAWTDLDKILSEIKSSPKVERALRDIAERTKKKLSDRKANLTRDDDGPGL